MSTNPFASDWLRAGHDDARRPQGGLSHVTGTTAEELKFMTIPALVDRAVSRFGAGEAVVFAPTQERLSWHTLKRRSDEIAAGLLALGVERGDRVGIWAPNCIEWLLVQLGTARIGAILVNINPAYRTSELEHALEKTQCRVLVMASALKSSDYVAMMRSLAPDIDTAHGGLPLRLQRFPKLERLVLIGDATHPPGFMRFKELATLAGPAHRNSSRHTSRSAGRWAILRSCPSRLPRSRSS